MKSVRALIIDDSSDLIKFVEQSPDTVITLLNGEKILRRRVLAGMGAWNHTSPIVFPKSAGSPVDESEG